MTQIVITHLVCDLCGEDIHGPDRRLYREGFIQPALGRGALFRSCGAIGGLDLCDGCAQPLSEALKERIDLLRGEGRLRHPA